MAYISDVPVPRLNVPEEIQEFGGRSLNAEKGGQSGQFKNRETVRKKEKQDPVHSICSNDSNSGDQHLLCHNRVLSHNCESSWDRGCRLDFTFHDCKQGQDLRKEQPAAEE